MHTRTLMFKDSKPHKTKLIGTYKYTTVISLIIWAAATFISIYIFIYRSVATFQMMSDITVVYLYVPINLVLCEGVSIRVS